MSGNSADAGRSVTSKVIAILLTFSDGNVYSLTEIARRTGLPISTTHRLAQEMAAWGMLERAEDGQYRIGMQLKAIASQAAPMPPSLHERARRVLEDLAAASPRSTVRLGVLEGLEVAYIEKAEGNHPVSMVFETTSLPAHATAMGKALLAFSSPQVVDAVIAMGLPRYTPFTLTSPERLRRALATIRLTRVAVSRRELDLTASAVAVPAFGAGRMPFLLSPDEAAPRIARAIAARRRLAVIPWQMALVSMVLRALPGWLFDRLASRAPRKPRS